MGLKEATRWKYLNKVLSLSKETTTNEKKKRGEETGTTVGRQLSRVPGWLSWSLVGKLLS